MSTNGKPVSVDFYFDFLCPWAFRASEWIRDVREQLGPDHLEINWRYFPLEQVNSEEGPDWKLWEQPDERTSRGLEMFHAALAAWQQDQGEKFDDFHRLVFRTRHGEYTVDGERPTIHQIAESLGFDMERFHKDMADRTLLSRIGEDYEFGASSSASSASRRSSSKTTARRTSSCCRSPGRTKRSRSGTRSRP